ncbi:DUF1648 domain-containing protein [Actinomadura rugatobispora]|uniref:DUF1648 domain-containing protein n=1 Tax=Actinomadura rugatobispora TaxID=1994 RepID=A0ABW1AHC5_9ACTN|nr:DUF1648 domain-containing protein [Actinomadura rugatobispora]
MAARRSLYMTAGIAALAGSALIPVAPLALRDRLPDPLATHWDGSGVPDGHSSFTAWTLMCAVTWLVFCASAVAVGLSGWGRRKVRGFTGATLGAGAGLTAGMIATTVRANLDRPSYREAGELGGGPVALVLLGAVVIALVGWMLGATGPDRPDAPPPGEEPRLRTRLGRGQRPVWVGYVRSRWVFLLGGALAVAGVLGALLALVLPEPLTPGMPLAGPLLALAVAGLAGLTLSSARVTVDGRGLAVAFGPIGRPVRRIPLETVSSAWVEERRPVEVGGWGYRLSGKGTTVMLRKGECLVVQHGPGDARFAVSVDDAERGAALLNALRE